MIRIINAKEEDCKYIFNLRNNPIVRKASFNSDKIDYETHKRWFTKTLDNPNRKIFIALNETSQKIGMVGSIKKRILLRLVLLFHQTCKVRVMGLNY